jgi:hypothetical protein
MENSSSISSKTTNQHCYFATCSSNVAATSNVPGEERSISASASTVQVMWTPPVQGMLKCNVDATIFKEQNYFGAGMY